jgi:hypothetical protein
MISATLAHRIALAAGLLGIVIVVVFGLVPIRECGTVPSKNAVIAEELARTQADVDAIFGSAPGTDCTAQRAHDLTVQTIIDCVAFVPAYGALMLFFFLAMVPRDEYAAFAGFVLSAVAMVADYAENACLFLINDHPFTPGWALAMIPLATGVKWLSLGFASAVGGLILLKAGRANYLAAFLCALGLLGPVLAIANPHVFQPMAGLTALPLLTFLVVAGRNALAAPAGD